MQGLKQLRTVVMIDAFSFTHAMRINEPDTLATLSRDLGLATQEFVSKGGTVVKSTGDGLILVFESAAQAVNASLAVLNAVAGSNLKYRIGIHAGEVTLTENDVFGDAVNICARLEKLCDPGGIYASRTVYDLIRAQAIEPAKYLGMRQVKGEGQSIEVYGWGEVARRRIDIRIPKSAIYVGLLAAVGTGAVMKMREPSASIDMKNPAAIRSALRSYQPDGSDADTLMDEAMNQVWEEMEAFDEVKRETLEKVDPSILLGWLKANPMGKRERGMREIEHWELVSMAIAAAKPKSNEPKEIKRAVTELSDPAMSLAKNAFQQEFGK